MNKEHRVLRSIGVAAALSGGLIAGLFGVASAKATGADGGGLDLTVQEDSSMSGPEQVAWIESQIPKAKEIYFSVQNMLDQARKEKDTLKITCLSDKLTQIHVNLSGIEERQEALKIAVQSGGAAAGNQQFAILKIYVARIQGLRAEAENCLGEADVVLGQTETTTTVSDDVTPSDPSDKYPEVPPVVETPPQASAFF
jgi:hypothetical protein